MAHFVADSPVVFYFNFFILIFFYIYKYKKSMRVFITWLFTVLMQVDVIVTTAGGIEEDLIKCLAPTYLGEFSLPGKELRQRGINR